jgi:hypothetical protein
MVVVLHSIIDYEPLRILKVYEGTCFGHVMSKACQYATNDEFFNVGVKKC